MRDAPAYILRHKRSLIFVTFLLALAGIISAYTLPVTLFPRADFPRLAVSVDAGERPAEQMQTIVTRPLEEALRQVPGVRSLRSTTSRGSAELSLNFDWGSDMGAALLQVNAATAGIMPSLPAGTTFEVRRMDPTVFPIIAYSLKSSQQSLQQLREFAQYDLVPLLTSVRGVARVDVQGGAASEYRVLLDPAKLEAYALTQTDITTSLAATGQMNADGRLEDHYRLYLIVADSGFKSSDDILDTVVGGSGTALVHLSDVGMVMPAAAPDWTRTNADGTSSILIQIFQQPDGNSVEIARGIATSLQDYKSQLPAGARLSKWYDQSELVTAAATSVRDAILIGVILAGIVLWLFLRNLHLTFITMLALPLVLAMTILLLRGFGMGFNIMTLGGMAAAVGLIIDDTIVMLEHLMRSLEEHGEQGRRLSQGELITAGFGFLRPLAGSSGATLVIFLPLVFLDGVTGAFFKALSLTMASSLAISFLLTLLVIPLLAGWILGRGDIPVHTKKPSSWVLRYQKTMQRLLTRPILLLLPLLLLAGSGYAAYTQVGTGFMPPMDEGGFILDYRAEPGTALSETDRLLRQVENIIRKIPEVETYSRRTGLQLGGGLTEANEGDFFIRLKPLPRRSIDEVMDDVRTQVEAQVPGLDIELALLMEDLIGDLTSVPQPVEVKLFGSNTDELIATANKVAGQLGKIEGLVDVRTGINPAGDTLQLRIDPNKAALAGLTPASINEALDAALTGTTPAQVITGGRALDVRVVLPQNLTANLAELRRLQLRGNNGQIVQLQQVAEINKVQGEPQITRENLKRMVAVTGRISGRDMGSALRDVNTALKEANLLPHGVSFELGGLYQQQNEAFSGLMKVFGAAIALVFLLLLYLYEDFQIALVILLMPLLSLGAVFIGLYLTDVELNVSAMMGMTMIIGIVTEVAIFYWSEFTSLDRNELNLQQRLITASCNRFRPIAMTTLAAILTLLPLAFAMGEGAAMQQPLAIVIISGLLLQLPLVLVVMPVAYAVLIGLPKFALIRGR